MCDVINSVLGLLDKYHYIKIIKFNWASASPPYTVRINASRKGLMNMMWSWLIEMATGISVQENTDETPCQSSSQRTTTFGSICWPLTQLNKCNTFKSCWPDKAFVREQTVILAAVVSITFWTPLEEKTKQKTLPCSCVWLIKGEIRLFFTKQGDEKGWHLIINTNYQPFRR